jgi:hypothetical protein
MNMAQLRRFDRRVLWFGLIVLAATVAAFLRVPITLGIKVPETQIRGLDPSLIDVSSHERIWRVWWRARGDFIDVDPQWLLTAGLIVLFAVFVAGTLAAIWFALSPERELIAEAE